jgi:hypothetical protein
MDVDYIIQTSKKYVHVCLLKYQCQNRGTVTKKNKIKSLICPGFLNNTLKPAYHLCYEVAIVLLCKK